MNLINKEAKSMINFNFGRIFTSSARAALLHILNSKLISNPEMGILLPSYIGLSYEEGSGIFDPVRSSGIKFRFYSVTDRLIPNLDEIEGFLKSGDFQLFLLVHYFGIPQVNTEDLVALCNSYGVMVIEDCAHVPIMSELSLGKLGKYGDYSIFSIHKNTSTKDGGYYFDNKGDLPILLNKELIISYETLNAFANTKINMAAEARLKNYIRIVDVISNFKHFDLFFNEIPFFDPLIFLVLLTFIYLRLRAIFLFFVLGIYLLKFNPSEVFLTSYLITAITFSFKFIVNFKLNLIYLPSFQSPLELISN
jgi:hypothetical protein